MEGPGATKAAPEPGMTGNKFSHLTYSFLVEIPQTRLSQLPRLQNGSNNPYFPCKFKLDAVHAEAVCRAKHRRNPEVIVFINPTVDLLFLSIL